MTTVRTRTERSRNRALIEARERAGRNLARYAGCVGWSFGFFIALARLWDYGAIGHLSTLLTLLSAFAVALWALGFVGIAVNALVFSEPIEPDELYSVSGFGNDTDPAPARLFVQTGPRRIEAPDLGFADTAEKVRLGKALAGDGWRWRRDPCFGIADVRGRAGRGYTAAYPIINQAAIKAGVVENGYVKPEFRDWFISPAPEVVTVIERERPDDDSSSREN